MRISHASGEGKNVQADLSKADYFVSLKTMFLVCIT